MINREQWTKFIDHPVVEWSIFVVGVILMLLSPLAGVIPGPGGIFVFAIGLAMVLKTSMWAKRHYVRFKTLAAQGRPLGRLGPAPPQRQAPRSDAQETRSDRLPAAARRARAKARSPRRFPDRR